MATNLLDLGNIKGRIAEALVKSIFRRAEYKMTRFGRESDLRGMLQEGRDESFSPDFLAMKEIEGEDVTRGVYQSHIVEVKYRSNSVRYFDWGRIVKIDFFRPLNLSIIRQAEYLDHRVEPMDVVSHGLWGGALFYRGGRKKFLAAVLLGMAPDVLSFGVFHAMRPGWIIGRLAGEISGPPALSILPAYVFYAYNVTHSLLVWAGIFFLLWRFSGRSPWLWGAWGVHILCDIPTHATSYFPTPFLWPLPTPFVDGISWATPEFMAWNYLSLTVVYAGLLWRLRKKRSL